MQTRNRKLRRVTPSAKPLWVGAALVTLTVANLAQAGETPMSVNDTIQRAIDYSVPLRRTKIQLREAALASKGIDAVYDTTIFGSVNHYEDASEQSSAFAGEARRNTSFEAGARQMFDFGTIVEAKLTHTRSETDFEETESSGTPPPQQQAPGAVSTPTTVAELQAMVQAQINASLNAALGNMFDPSQFTTFNPGYRTELSVSVVQPLWRNFGGRELKMQRVMAERAQLGPKAAAAATIQGVATKAGQMHWQLVGLIARRELLKRSITLAEEFVKVTRSKIRYGRATANDVVGAEAQVAALKQGTVALEQAIDNIRSNYVIGLRMEPDAVPTPTERLTPLAVTTPLPDLPDAATALERARAQRVDMQMIKDRVGTAEVQRMIAEEKSAPKLDAIAKLGTTGFEDDFGNSFVSTVDDVKHLTWLVGLQFEMKLDQAEAKIETERASAARDMAMLDAAEMDNQIKLDIELAMTAIRTAIDQMASLQEHLTILQRRLATEQKDFAIGRSDQALLIAYQQEILRTQGDTIDAQVNYQTALLQLEAAQHAFDVKETAQ